MLLNTKRKIFNFEHRIYFNETNAVGGVAYFSNYVKWQGMAREEYFIQTVPTWLEIMKLVSSGQLNMITVEEHSHFIQHAYFGDHVSIQLQTYDVKKYSFLMLFFVVNLRTRQLLYEGIQKLAFDDFKGKFVAIPPAMLESIQQHLIDQHSERLQKLKKFFNIT